MSKWEIVKRPELEPPSGDRTDPQQDWRKFVMDEIGYDEKERARLAHRIDWRAFSVGVFRGLVLFAVAFGAIFTAMLWHDGIFDRFMPVPRGATIQPPPSWIHANRKPSNAVGTIAGQSSEPPWPDIYAQPAVPAPTESPSSAPGEPVAEEAVATD